MNKQVSRMPSVQAAVAANAERLAAQARMLAAPHGSLASRITVERDNPADMAVVLSDNGKGKNEPAAAAIEFGGRFKNGRVQPGLRVLSRAVDAM